MKKPFEVGDSVACYDLTGRQDGVIREIYPARCLLVVTLPRGSEYQFHMKQCRRLLQKKRRRVWLNVKLLDEIPHKTEFKSTVVWKGEQPLNPDFREFIEVRKK